VIGVYFNSYCGTCGVFVFSVIYLLAFLKKRARYFVSSPLGPAKFCIIKVTIANILVAAVE
jgi:hypothetical protein